MIERGMGIWRVMVLVALWPFMAMAETYTAAPPKKAEPPATAQTAPMIPATPPMAPIQKLPSPTPVFPMPSFDALKKVEPLRHMQVAKPAPPTPPIVKTNEKPAGNPADAMPAKTDTAQANPKKPMGACKDHVSDHIAGLTPSDELSVWAPLKDMLANVNPDRVSIGLAELEKNPGTVPPMGLYLAARALQDRGQLRKATFYYYAGRLRSKVDLLRWPAPSDSPARGSRRALNRLGEDVGKTLAPWAHDDASRLLHILRDVQDWDAKTPYAYHPGYRLSPREAPFAEWGDRIKTARIDFAKECDDLVAALKTLGK